MDKKELNSYLRDLHGDLMRLQCSTENSLDQINHLIADIHRTRMELVDNLHVKDPLPVDKIFDDLLRGLK